MTQKEIENYLTCDARKITEADITRVKKAVKIAKIERDTINHKWSAGAFFGVPKTIDLFEEKTLKERRYNGLDSLLKYMLKVKEYEKETAENE